jgi:hypothetical protein
MMVGDDRQQNGGTDEADDWFDGPGSTVVDDERSGEDWSDEHAPPAREPGRPADAGGADGGAGPADRFANAPWLRIAVIAGAAIVVLLAVLAAAGVFSGGGGSSSSSEPPTTAPATTTTKATTPTPAPKPAVTAPATVLKPGASGDDVKALQRALAAAGHSPGAVDGVYGPSTQQAVAAFQTSAGLTADGVYGPETKAALQQSLNSG